MKQRGALFMFAAGALCLHAVPEESAPRRIDGLPDFSPLTAHKPARSAYPQVVPTTGRHQCGHWVRPAPHDGRRAPSPWEVRPWKPPEEMTWYTSAS